MDLNTYGPENYLKKPLLVWLKSFQEDENELKNLHNGIFLLKIWQKTQKDDLSISPIKNSINKNNFQISSTPCKNSQEQSEIDYNLLKNQIDKSSENNLSESYLSEEHFSTDKAENLKNLSILITNLKNFYEQTLGQLIVLKLPDIFRIANFFGNNDQEIQDLNNLVLLLLGSAVQCDKKEFFIEKIKQLDLVDQHELVECIQQITDNPISVWSINEWSEINLLPQADHEKMYNFLYLHVQNLVQERDQLFFRLVKTIFKIENLSEKCNCGFKNNDGLYDFLSIQNNSTIALTNITNLTNITAINNQDNFGTEKSFTTNSIQQSSFSILNNLSSSLISSKIQTCSNCCSVLANSFSNKTSKIESKAISSETIDDSSLNSNREEDDNEQNKIKLKKTLEELNDLRQKLRVAQSDLEEKKEMLVELKELLEQSKETCVNLRDENLELAQEARSVKAYRDEIDILNEKVRTFNHLENELQKYKLKMNEFDFYKARVEELKDENRLLTESKVILEEQLEINKRKTENFNDIEMQLYQMKAYSSELKAQRELDKDKIQNLIEQVAELQVEKKAIIEELSVCQGELKHLRSQLNNSQVYLNDYENKNSCGSVFDLNNGEENNLKDINLNSSGVLSENETNLKTSLLEQLNNDASKRILKLELENQKLNFIIENLRSNNSQKHSSISSLSSNHSLPINSISKKNKNISSNQFGNLRLNERCSSNSSTDSIKSTSLSVCSTNTSESPQNLSAAILSNSNNTNVKSTNQYSLSNSPVDCNNEYDSGCVSLVCDSKTNGNSITPVNMLRMQQQQKQLDKEVLENKMNNLNLVNKSISSEELSKHENKNKLEGNMARNIIDTSKTYTAKHNNLSCDKNKLSVLSNSFCKKDLINNQINSNSRSCSENSNNLSEGEPNNNNLRIYSGSSNTSTSSLSSNASSFDQKNKCTANLWNSFNKEINYDTTKNKTISPSKKNFGTKTSILVKDQNIPIDVKRMPLVETNQIENELNADRKYLTQNNFINKDQISSNGLIEKSRSYLDSNQQKALYSQLNCNSPPPPKLPPRNPQSLNSSNCSSNNFIPNSVIEYKNSPENFINKQCNQSLKNSLITKSKIENSFAFNFVTNSSCTVNNSIKNSNGCTIRQTTTHCGPTSIVMHSSNYNNSGTNFISKITTTTASNKNDKNLQKLNNLILDQKKDEKIEKNFSKTDLNLSNQSDSNYRNPNFVRGVFRSCNVNFGPDNFKSQAFLSKLNSNRKFLNNSNDNSNKFNRNSSSNEYKSIDNNCFEKKSNLSLIPTKNSLKNNFIVKTVLNKTSKNDTKTLNNTDVVTSGFNYLTNSVSSPSLNSESDEDDEYEETVLQNICLNDKNLLKNKSIQKQKINTNCNTNQNNFNEQTYSSSPLQRSKTLMLNSNGKPELNRKTRPQRIEIITTHHHPNSTNNENHSHLSSPVSTVSTKSVWYEYGCV